MTRWKFWLGIVTLAPLAMTGCGGSSTSTPPADAKGTGSIQAVCSFFPMYVFTKNVVGDRSNVEVSLLLPAQHGCPHDYDLSTKDLKKIASATLFIKNGAGLEEFRDQQLLEANPKLTIVDTSKGIQVIEAECDHEHEEEGEEHHHHHGEANPHFFSSPADAAVQVRNIAEALAKADPAGAEVYRKNAEAYASRLEDLGAEFANATFGKRKIVTMHEVFDYLAKRAKLNVVETIQVGPNFDPSAGRRADLVGKMKKGEIVAIFTEPQYSDKVAKTLGDDAGVPVYQLDPVASGPDDASLDYYESVMRANLATLKKALGAESS